MNICTRRWLRPYLKYQARKTSRLTIRRPIISMPLPEGPGIAFSVDCFGPLPVTSRGNTYILLFTDRHSRPADMFAATVTEFTAGGTANIIINRNIPLWGCPHSIISDNSPQPCSKLGGWRRVCSVVPKHAGEHPHRACRRVDQICKLSAQGEAVGGMSECKGANHEEFLVSRLVERELSLEVLGVRVCLRALAAMGSRIVHPHPAANGKLGNRMQCVGKG